MPSEQATAVTATDTDQVPITALVPSPDNPRREISERGVAALAESIRRCGILQPLVVTRQGETYQVRAGHRRLGAARLAGLDQVPVRIVEADEDLAREISLHENLQREDLSPSDELRAFTVLVEAGRSAEEIAEMVGRSIPYVRQRLSLQQLDEKVLKALEEDRIRFGHAVAISRLGKQTEQRAILSRILDRGAEHVSVKDVRDWTAGWRHDAFAFAATQVKPCKSCRQPQPELFEDEKPQTCATCSDIKHLVREDDHYRARVEAWVRDQGLELEEEQTYHWVPPNLRTGEPPFKVPKGATTLIRVSKWRDGEYITIGWRFMKAVEKKKSGRDGAPKQTRTPEQGRQRAAQQAAQRHLQFQITETAELRSDPFKPNGRYLIAFALLSAFDMREREEVVQAFGLDAESVDLWDSDDLYRLVTGLEESRLSELIAAAVQIELRRQPIEVMADALIRYLQVDPVATYEATPEDLKVMRKDEIRTLLNEHHQEAVARSHSKGKHITELTGVRLREMVWPELEGLLSGREEGKT